MSRKRQKERKRRKGQKEAGGGRGREAKNGCEMARKAKN